MSDSRHPVRAAGAALWAVPCLLLGQALAPLEEGGYSLIVLPDTQYYYNDQGDRNYLKWIAQGRWILDHAEDQRIQYVLHLGDVTDEGDHSEIHRSQWEGAHSMGRMITSVCPLAVTTGNHDVMDNGRDGWFSEAFAFGPGTEYATQASLAGVFEPDRYENSYHLFSAEGRDWMVLCLEWGPRNAVIAWANEVLRAYPERTVVVVVHAYLFRDSSRYDWRLLGAEDAEGKQSGNPKGYGGLQGNVGGVHDGQDLWENLVLPNDNVKWVVCGHVSRSGHGRRTVIRPNGTVVHEHLVNFQHWTGDGNGYMRRYAIAADNRTVAVQSFSPYTREVLPGPDLEFNFGLQDGALPVGQREAVRGAGPVISFEPLGHSPGRPLLLGVEDGLVGATYGSGLTGEFPEGSGFSFSLEGNASEWTSLGWTRLTGPVGERVPWFAVDGGPAVEFEIVAEADEPVTEGRERLKVSTLEGESVVTVSLPAKAWHHVAVSQDAKGWRLVVDNEAERWERAEGDFGGQVTFGWPQPDTGRERRESGAVARSLGVRSWALFDRSLSAADLEAIWLSEFRVGGTVEVDADKALHARGPSLSARWAENGNLLFGQRQPSYYRLPDDPEASRDPNSRYLTRDRLLEYSDGLVVAVDERGQGLPVQLKTANAVEKAYFGTRYSGTGRSVLNLAADGARAVREAVFVPFREEIPGGYLESGGRWLYRSGSDLAELEVGADGVIIDGEGGAIPWVVETGRGGVTVRYEASASRWILESAAGSLPGFGLVLLPEVFADGYAGHFAGRIETESGPVRIEKIGTGEYHVAVDFSSVDRVLFARPVVTGEGEASPELELERTVSGWTVRLRDARGEAVDGGFIWWLHTGPRVWRTRAEVALADAVQWRDGWHYSGRMGWIYALDGLFPWVWHPEDGWVWLYRSGEEDDGGILWGYWSAGQEWKVY